MKSDNDLISASLAWKGDLCEAGCKERLYCIATLKSGV